MHIWEKSDFKTHTIKYTQDGKFTILEIIVNSDIFFEMEGIDCFVVVYFIAFSQIVDKRTIAVIFHKAVIDDLRKVAVDIIGSRQDRVDIFRLTDTTFYIFSSIIRLGDRFPLVERISRVNQG